MSRQLKIHCNVCGSEGYIRKSDNIHQDFKKIHCECKNPDCRHRWVARVEFSHTTHASRITEKGFLNYLLDKLPLQELQNLEQIIKQRKQVTG